MNNIALRWVSEEERDALDVISKDPGYEWPHSKEYFEELIHLKRALVAFDGKSPVGYLLFQVIWGNTPFFSQVWINDKYQGRGIGKMLYGEFEERIKSEGYDSICTSNEANNSAGIAFVKKMGFIEIGTLQMDYGPEIFSLKNL